MLGILPKACRGLGCQSDRSGILPLCEFEHGLRAIELAAQPMADDGWQPHPASPPPDARQLVDEAAAKQMLSAAGIMVPRGGSCRTVDLAAAAGGLPRRWC